MQSEEKIREQLAVWKVRLEVDGKPDSYYKFYEGRIAALEWVLDEDKKE
jgi:hypothetical protein